MPFLVYAGYALVASGTGLLALKLIVDLAR